MSASNSTAGSGSTSPTRIARQRPTNENTNGLLRQYFPKSINFDLVDNARIREVAEELNDRPRLCLGDRSPRQLMARRHRQLTTA